MLSKMPTVPLGCLIYLQPLQRRAELPWAGTYLCSQLMCLVLPMQATRVVWLTEECSAQAARCGRVA
jgi:hypothetical protein